MLLHLQWPSEFRLTLKGLEGGQGAQSRTLLLSLTGPTEDQVATLRLVWRPDFGGSIPRNECEVMGLRDGSRYPSNQALAWCDSSQAEELLALGKAANADNEGEVLYRLDKAPSKLQYWRIYQAISEIYKLPQAPGDLVGVPLDVITFFLNQRAIDRKDRIWANE
eukprot:5983420-Pyramimonas_sp.AAC.1